MGVEREADDLVRSTGKDTEGSRAGVLARIEGRRDGGGEGEGEEERGLLGWRILKPT